MRRCKFVLLLLLVVLLLTGCVQDLFKTAEYRAYKSFSEKYQAGTEAQKILAELGCPDAYNDGKGNYCPINRADRESYTEKLSATPGTIWYYECYELPDPANPCRLVITFNDEGKSTNATFSYVPGG